MTNTTGKINLLGLTQSEMEQFFESIGEKRFRAGQVMKWIHHFGVDDFAALHRDAVDAVAGFHRGIRREDVAQDPLEPHLGSAAEVGADLAALSVDDVAGGAHGG